jgi:hypothetical protein
MPAVYEDREAVEMFPFSISPTEITLGTNESVDLSVTYSPATMGKFSRKFFLLCDNCTVLEYEVFGSAVNVSVCTSAVCGRQLDASSEIEVPPSKLLMGSVVPGTVSEDSWSVTNTAPLAVSKLLLIVFECVFVSVCGFG